MRRTTAIVIGAALLLIGGCSDDGDQDASIADGVASCVDEAGDAEAHLLIDDIELDGAKPLLDLAAAEIAIEGATTHMRFVVQPSAYRQFDLVEQYGWNLTFLIAARTASNLVNISTDLDGEIDGARFGDEDSDVPDLDVSRATSARNSGVIEISIPTEDLLLEDLIEWSASTLLSGNADEETPMFGQDVCGLELGGEGMLAFPGEALDRSALGDPEVSTTALAPQETINTSPDIDDNGIDLNALRTELAEALTAEGFPTRPHDVDCAGEGPPNRVPPGDSFTCTVPPDVNGALTVFVVTVTGIGTYEWEYADV